MYDIGDIVDLGDWGTLVLTDDTVAVMHDQCGYPSYVVYDYDSAASLIRQGFIAIPVGDGNNKHFGATFAALRDAYIDYWG